MLKKLVIRNIALMDFAEIDFSQGLNVLSGETGAGKSVIIDSLNFVLGAKADKAMIRYGQEFCSVEAVFTINRIGSLKEVLDSFEIEDDELIIFRKFNMDGRGDIKINGSSFSVSMLKKITQYLVDVHGQSDHFYLLKESNQLDLIDRYAHEEIDGIKEKLALTYNRFKKIRKETELLGGDESARAIKLDILNYQIGEIERAELEDGEEEVLCQTKEKLENAEKILSSAGVARDCIGGEGGISEIMLTACHHLSSLSRYGAPYDALSEQMESLRCELDDVERSLSAELDGAEFDNEELERVESRLETIKQLRKKYGSDYAEIMRFYENALSERDRLVRFEEQSECLNKEENACKKELYEGYVALHNARTIAAAAFSESVTAQLRTLGMNSACFVIRMEELPHFSEVDRFVGENGLDCMEFLFSANKGEPVKPLSKIISGGEISRFMLALKSQTAKLQSISTFVFDEIDAGISGVIAKVVAEKFAEIALHTQIIAITHLPQIAAMSDQSFLIVKQEEADKTVSTIKELDRKGKIAEVNRLAGGSPKSEIAIRHAEALVAEAEEYKNNR